MCFGVILLMQYLLINIYFLNYFITEERYMNVNGFNKSKSYSQVFIDING